jgi:hypothetical protein
MALPAAEMSSPAPSTVLQALTTALVPTKASIIMKNLIDFLFIAVSPVLKGLYAASQKQNDDNYQQYAETTAGVIPPT